MKKSRWTYKTQLLFVLYHCRNRSWKNQNSLSDLKSSCVTLIIHLALNLVVFVCSSHASKSVIQFHLSLYRNYFNFHTWELLENAWPVSENVWFFQEQINNWMLIVVYLSPLYATRSWLCCLLCKFFFTTFEHCRCVWKVLNLFTKNIPTSYDIIQPGRDIRTSSL